MDCEWNNIAAVTFLKNNWKVSEPESSVHKCMCFTGGVVYFVNTLFYVYIQHITEIEFCGL